MIAVSLLLILVAVALLVAGVVGSTNALIVGSIVVTVFAAIVLVAGVREALPIEPDTDPDPTGDPLRLTPPPAVPTGPDRFAGPPRRPAGHGYGNPFAPTSDGATLVEDPAGRTDIPIQSGDPSRRAYRSDDPDTDPDRGSGGQESWPDATGEPYDQDAAGGPAGDADDEDPPDEPAPQVVPASVAAAVARLDAEVIVVDGRPRYHLDTCEHLDGRESEPIAVSEAVE